MHLEQAISRAVDLVNEPGNSRLSALDCEAILILARAGRMQLSGVMEEECAPLRREDVA